MEKRLLLAFLLSFGILLIWNSLFPKKNEKSILPLHSQLIENKGIIEHSPPQSPPPSLPVEKTESIATIQNEKLIIKLSDLGGIIHSITIKEFNETLPVYDFLNIQEFSSKKFQIKEITGNKIVYSFEQGAFLINRTYELEKDKYLIKAVTDFSGEEMSKQGLDISSFTLDITSLDKKIENSRDKTLFEYAVSTDERELRKANAFKFTPKEAINKLGNIKWSGFRDRYFCTVIKNDFPTESWRIEPVQDKILRIISRVVNKKETNKINSGFKSVIYYGPQKLDLLQENNLGIDEIMKFSNFSLFDAISKAIYNIMNGIYKIIPNWGVCIILISLLIYGIMFPLTFKSMSSMKKMQSLQPRINQIREQYKNNPQRLNKEMMDLYKEHKVNPFGGCLPLILQMPIFIGLYQVLWRSVAFKGSKFLWIKDLSEPDRLFILPTNMPLIGNEINILPIVMMIVMYFQQKISAQNMVTSDPNQQAQQKMMTTIFPIFLGFIFYKFASGLSLYFTIFYLLSTITQYKLSKPIIEN
jgi:YidC/Oxa1 family membrane protein insertase